MTGVGDTVRLMPDAKSDPHLRFIWPEDTPLPANPVVVAVDSLPALREPVYAHTDANACPRCTQRCANVHTAEYRRGTWIRRVLAALASVIGGVIIVVLVPLSGPVSPGSAVAAAFTAAGWAATVFGLSTVGRHATEGFWPKRDEWRKAGGIMFWSLVQIALALAPAYLAATVFRP